MKLVYINTEVKIKWLTKPKIATDNLSNVFTIDESRNNCSTFTISQEPFRGVKFKIGHANDDTGTIRLTTKTQRNVNDIISLIEEGSQSGFAVVAKRTTNKYKGKIKDIDLSDNQGIVKYMVENKIRGNIRVKNKKGPLRVAVHTIMTVDWLPRIHIFFGTEFKNIVKTILLAFGGFRDLWLPQDILITKILPIVAFQYQRKFLEDEAREKNALVDAHCTGSWVRKKQELYFYDKGVVYGTCVNPVIMNMIFCYVAAKSKKRSNRNG